MLKSCLFGGLAAALVVSFPVNAQVPANDGCAGAVTVVGLGSFPFTTVGATTGNPANSICNNTSPGNVFNDVWYKWVANYTGGVVFSTCGGTTLDTKLALYHATVCPPGPPLDCADDSCGLQTEIGASVVSGETYLLRIGSFAEGNRGTGTFTIKSGVVSGPVTNPANNHRYYLLGPDSYTGARARAIALGGTLATINDAAENTWVVTNVINKNATTRHAWIGYTDAAVEGTWVWESGDVSAYNNWLAPNPNNFGGLEHYAEIDGANGTWADRRDLPSLLVFAVVEVSTPTCTADFNNLGGATVQDIYDYLAAFSAGSPLADINHADGLTVQDIYDFLEIWVAGCP